MTDNDPNRIYSIRLAASEYDRVTRALSIGGQKPSTLARLILLAAADNILAAVGDVPDPETERNPDE